jgi:hypothetical protein
MALKSFSARRAFSAAAILILPGGNFFPFGFCRSRTVDGVPRIIIPFVGEVWQ